MRKKLPLETEVRAGVTDELPEKTREYLLCIWTTKCKRMSGTHLLSWRANRQHGAELGSERRAGETITPLGFAQKQMAHGMWNTVPGLAVKILFLICGTRG